MNIEELIQEEIELNKKLSINRKLQRDIYQKEFEDKIEFKIGDEVIYRGVRARIVNIEGNKLSSYIYIARYKKDGTLFSRPTRLYFFDFIYLSKTKPL